MALLLVTAAIGRSLSVYLPAALGLVQMLYLDKLGSEADRRYWLFVPRLEAYANLSGLDKADTAGILSSGAHQVLLGALKKVEAKAASLLVVLALTLTLSVTVAVAASEADERIKLLLLATVYLHPLPIISVLLCFKQLDNLEIREGLLEKQLQSDLLESLNEKELRFRFASDVAHIIVVVGLIGLALWIKP
jgi:hypothetical protein